MPLLTNILNLANLPNGQIIVSPSGTVYLGATGSPTDSHADFIYTPSGAGQYFVFDTSSTQPLVIRQSGGSTSGTEIDIWHSGSAGNVKLADAASGAGKVFTITGSSAASGGGGAGGPILLTPGAADGAGAVGYVAIEQPGGTPGTNETDLYHSNSGGDALHIRVAGTTNGSHYIFYGAAGLPTLQLLDNGGNAYAQIGNGSGGMILPGGFQYLWGSSTYATSANTGLQKVAGSVVGPTNGSSGAGWFQNTAGHKCLDANATNATNSVAASNLAFTLIGGRTYSIKGKITGGNSTAAEGFQFQLTSDGTLSATRIDLSVIGTNGTVTPGTTRVTALGTSITFTTFTATSDVYFTGEIKVNVGGVLTLQFAENSAHVSGTATLSAGSWLEFNDCVAV
jgi:hypothetical protein